LFTYIMLYTAVQFFECLSDVGKILIQSFRRQASSPTMIPALCLRVGDEKTQVRRLNLNPTRLPVLKVMPLASDTLSTCLAGVDSTPGLLVNHPLIKGWFY